MLIIMNFLKTKYQRDNGYFILSLVDEVVRDRHYQTIFR